MKKVFSTYAFLESVKVLKILFPEPIQEAIETWVPECEGKTEEACNLLGYRIKDSWLVNEDEYKPYQGNN